VADARRTAEIAKEHGATITHGPTEVPGGDWVFTGLDRQGAVFAAHSKKRVAAPKTNANAKVTKDTKKASAPKVTKKKTASTGRARLQSRKKTTTKKRR